MKNFTKFLLCSFGVALMTLTTSCGKKTYLATLTPEENGLNVVKITDESKNLVLGSRINTGHVRNPEFATLGTNKEHNVYWAAIRALAVSPDGDEIAYMTKIKGQQNIIVRSTSGSTAATQRTFRNVGDFSWGVDGNLYFIDMTDNQNKLCSVDAHAGTFTRQLTNNNMDYDPILSPDGKKVFFTRYDRSAGPCIWSYNLENGQLTNCAAGFHPSSISEDGNEFICVRNSDQGHSEIWKVNYVSGRETILLSDKDKSFTHPNVSPDGEWMLVTANSKSTINKRKNLDIYAVKTDGSSFVQLTYHPANDCCPQWSADGESIYFLSDRANKDNSFNVWRMNFRPDNGRKNYRRPLTLQEEKD